MNRKLIAAVAVLGVLTAGCELRADLRLDLNADESGQISLLLGLDEEFQSLVELSDEPIEDSLFGADNPFGELPGAEQRTYTEGDFTYYEASLPFDDLNALALIGEDADNLVDQFGVTFDEETARVSGNLDLGEVTGGDLADDQLAGIATDAIAEFFDINVQVAMPGDVISHNADRVLDDGSLEWDIPLSGEVSTLSIVAESDLTAGSGGFPTLIALIVLAFVGGFIFIVMRSRQSSAAPAATASPEDVPPPTVTEMPEIPPATE